MFWKVTLHILGTKLVPVAQASPRSHTIQPLRLYSYSLHMYMKILVSSSEAIYTPGCGDTL